MGYIIELRAGFLDRLVAELTDPTLPAPKPSKQDSIYTKEVRERWGQLQRVVAEQARMTDDVVAGPDVATYITEVITRRADSGTRSSTAPLEETTFLTGWTKSRRTSGSTL